MKIYNRKHQLADWIKRKLGFPLIDVLPLDDTQLDDIIDDTVFYFGEFAGGIGNEEQFLLIDTCTINGAEDDTNRVSLEEGNCDEYDVASAGVSGRPYIIYKSEYQLPRNVLAIMQEFPEFSGGTGMAGDDQSLLRYGAFSAGAGAVGSLTGFGGGALFGTALFLGQGTLGYSLYSSFGTRGGSRYTGGGGIDIISYEIGLEYLEMFRQRYTVKLRAQMLEQSRKVRFSPRPGGGAILLGVWARVADEWLYDNYWVREYALALAKIQIGSNLKLYKNMTFPGGVTLNSDDFTNEGREEKEKLEEQLRDFKFGFPPDFMVG